MSVHHVLERVLSLAGYLADRREQLSASLHLYGNRGSSILLLALGGILILLSTALGRLPGFRMAAGAGAAKDMPRPQAAAALEDAPQ